RHVYYRRHRHFALVGASQRATDAAAQPQSGIAGGLGHGLEARDRLGDGTVDVLLRKRFAGRAEDHYFVGLGSQGALEAFQVGREHRINHARLALDARHDIGSVRHLRYPLGRYERGGLDIGKPRSSEAVDKFHLDIGGDDLFFVLQAVAGRNLDDLDAGGQRHVSSCVCKRARWASTAILIIAAGGYFRRWNRPPSRRATWPASSSSSNWAFSVAISSPVRACSASRCSGSKPRARSSGGSWDAVAGAGAWSGVATPDALARP